MTTHRKISGLVYDGKYPRSANVAVRFTSDDKGETLSLTAGNVMIAVPFEAVEPIIKKERKKA